MTYKYVPTQSQWYDGGQVQGEEMFEASSLRAAKKEVAERLKEIEKKYGPPGFFVDLAEILPWRPRKWGWKR